MMVTDLNYHIETKLVQKLDIMIKRCTDKESRKDAVLIIEGYEGDGKTNTSEAIGYYVKYTSGGMPIYMFFRLDSMIEFAKSHEGCIIIWDEPSLDALSADWFKETVKNLIRLLMTCRKKRHFFILNLTKFFKFPEYIVVDRALALIHMYQRRNEQGRFVYIRKKYLEQLFLTYRQKKIRAYGKYRSFGGRMPLVEHLFDKMDITIEGKPHCTFKDYEKIKDESILSIGRKDNRPNKQEQELNRLKKAVSDMKMPINNKDELALKLGISVRTLFNWGKANRSISAGAERKDIIEYGEEGGLSSGEVEEMD